MLLSWLLMYGKFMVAAGMVMEEKHINVERIFYSESVYDDHQTTFFSHQQEMVRLCGSVQPERHVKEISEKMTLISSGQREA